MRNWTEEAKQAQREAIRSWSPWTRSTGPRTHQGKLVSSRNARARKGTAKHCVRMIADSLKALRTCGQLHRAIEAEKNLQKRTIMNEMLYQADQHFTALVLLAFDEIEETFSLSKTRRDCKNSLVVCGQGPG